MTSNRRALVRHQPRINHKGEAPALQKRPFSPGTAFTERRIQIRIQRCNEQSKRNNSFYGARIRERGMRGTVSPAIHQQN